MHLSNILYIICSFKTFMNCSRKTLRIVGNINVSITWIDLRSTEYQAGAQSTRLSAHSTQFVVACMWA